jgi:hypothetical protein
MKRTPNVPKPAAADTVLAEHERRMQEAHAPIVAMGGWPLPVAFAAANMAQDVSYRLVAALVLIEHLQHPSPHLADDGGWTLVAVRELVDDCRRDLLAAVTEPVEQTAGGAR